MEQLLQQIEGLKKEINSWNSGDAESFRIKYLGSKGLVKAIMGEMKNVAVENRKEAGQLLNEFKVFTESRYEELKASSTSNGKPQTAIIDLTLPGDPMPLGSRHPISLVKNRIISIFQRLGFAVAEGPEIEDDFHNFTALNLPENHPARDMQDTFYISQNPDWLLRTHTSSVQVREMEKGKLPIRIICPGRVYRNEEVNARKYPLFHQVEGLLIEKDVTFGQLKGTLNLFIQRFFRSFGKPIETRFRPDFFPFTEPSAELDALCPFCDGKGTNCRTCGQRGWLELLGCGMVDPAVLSAVGIDPEEYSGFAFGMGLERLAMLRYGIKDIRFFYSNHMDFLRQF